MRLPPFFIALFLTLTLLSRAANPPATLKDAYGQYFELGVALPGHGLTQPEIQLVASQFTNITTENCLKEDHVHPAEGTYDFQEGDSLIALAQKYHLKVNGHNLVWHHAAPEWFFEDHAGPAGSALVLERMQDHIAAVVGRYRGKIASWDVVNEAISDEPAQYLRNSKWKSAIGDEYISDAFLAAQKADPQAALYYNDYSIENPIKRAKALRLIHDLRAAGARIDGIGIQGHWALGKVPFRNIEESIDAFHKEGLKVMITELDLDVVPRSKSGADAAQKDNAALDPYPNGCPPAILEAQARDYAALFRLFLKHASEISRITFWNLDDGRSWLNQWPRKRTNYPLLWDRNLQPKPAFHAVIAAAQ